MNEDKTIDQVVAELVSECATGTGDSSQLKLVLFSLALSIDAKRILELGVRDGGTTLPLLAAAHFTKGYVTSVDIAPTTFQETRFDIFHRWCFCQQDALYYLKKDCDANVSMRLQHFYYDFVYVDDWHSYEHVKQELEYLDQLVRPGSIIAIHDTMYGNTEPYYHTDLTPNAGGQWANGGPYRAIAELDPQFWEFSTVPSNNGLTILRKKYTSKYK